MFTKTGRYAVVATVGGVLVRKIIDTTYSDRVLGTVTPAEREDNAKMILRNHLADLAAGPATEGPVKFHTVEYLGE